MTRETAAAPETGGSSGFEAALEKLRNARASMRRGMVGTADGQLAVLEALLVRLIDEGRQP